KAALSVLHALGAWCTVMDINIGTLREISSSYRNTVNTMMCTQENIKKLLPNIDMVLNCVKWPKGRKDFLITKDMLKLMDNGSVLVDISNDDDGAIESFRETTHENPRYIEEGVVHYCVSNIPGAIAHSTSVAYASSLVGHFLSILNNGVAEACVKDGFLRRSLTTYKGYLTHEETSALQNRPWIKPEDILNIADQNLDPAPPATVSKSTNWAKLQ
ncbi:MAG: alanine dehydrogenase, partial [Anaerotignaceae bacterium]